MTKQGHQKISVGAALVTIAITYGLTNSYATAIMSATLVIWGGTAPDWLEIAKWVKGERQSIIPHRTITHWLAAWIAAVAWFGYQITLPSESVYLDIIYILMFGFTIGGLTHVLCDWMTPMGVPIYTPFKRKSLYLVKGTALENPIAVLALIGGAASIWISYISV